MNYLVALCALALTVNACAQFDDYSTPAVNEGKIGSGFDDYSTEDVNEGEIEWD
jgi:hypothetical protein